MIGTEKPDLDKIAENESLRSKLAAVEAERDGLREENDAISLAVVNGAAMVERAEKERDLWKRHADSNEEFLDRLEAAAVEVNPYPAGYRPVCYESLSELPGEVKKLRAELSTLRAAAEGAKRVIKVMHPEGYDPSICETCRVLDELDAALTPAADGEASKAVTEDWLRSIGFKWNDDLECYEINYLLLAAWRDEWRIGYGGLDVAPWMADPTRGDVLRLLAVLGIEAKGGGE